MYLSITGVDNKKLTKYQPFETEAEAIAHATEYGGFAVEDIGGDQKFWVVDATAKTITQDSVAEASATVVRNAQDEIHALEATITPRRLRDALANDAGKSWVAAVEAKIATERGKL
jgi:hypothetical protein